MCFWVISLNGIDEGIEMRRVVGANFARRVWCDGLCRVENLVPDMFLAILRQFGEIRLARRRDECNHSAERCDVL